MVRVGRCMGLIFWQAPDVRMEGGKFAVEMNISCWEATLAPAPNLVGREPSLEVHPLRALMTEDII